MNKISKKNEIERMVTQILQTKIVEDQFALQVLLQEQGIRISQATLSRLIKKLHIVKQGGRYVLFEHESKSPVKVLSVQSNDSGLIIVKTLPGHAQAVAAFFDEAYVQEGHCLKTIFLGSIAGDDTVLVVLSRSSESKNAVEVIEKDFK